MSLSHDDVVRIIQLLDASHFDELRLEIEGVKLDIRRNGASERSGQISQSTEPQSRTTQSVVAQAPAAPPVAVKPSAVVESGLVEIRAPMLGVYYGAPKPGAAPFVAPGSVLEKDTVVGIIEVMKLMNSVSAGVAGTVVEVLAQDGAMVEFDEVLLRVRPA